MRQSLERGLAEPQHSRSGLVQGGAARMRQWIGQGTPLLAPSFSRMIAAALAVAEVNACMGRVVAAPTAGACGVLPAAIFTVAGERQVDDEAVLRAFFTAGGIGLAIEKLASLSGAEGGCQAEVGSASAMAAGALVELLGGSPAQVDHAVAFALANVLGLICDPVGGLVEVPCVKRKRHGRGERRLQRRDGPRRAGERVLRRRGDRDHGPGGTPAAGGVPRDRPRRLWLPCPCRGSDKLSGLAFLQLPGDRGQEPAVLLQPARAARASIPPGVRAHQGRRHAQPGRGDPGGPGPGGPGRPPWAGSTCSCPRPRPKAGRSGSPTAWCPARRQPAVPAHGPLRRHRPVPPGGGRTPVQPGQVDPRQPLGSGVGGPGPAVPPAGGLPADHAAGNSAAGRPGSTT